MNRFIENRQFLKANHNLLRQIITDRQKNMPQPSILKPYEDDDNVIDLPQMRSDVILKNDLHSCINDRRSVRIYSKEFLSLDELSYLLWATQGIKCIIGDNVGTLRTVPASGATHSFETYLLITRIEGLKSGVYRYLPLRHALYLIQETDDVESIIDRATPDQPYVPHFAEKAAVLFAWSCVPYRAEYKFDMAAHKKILIEVGHVCQNLYIAGESINCGTCAIGNYDQGLIDSALQLDGEDEFVIYLAALGKKA